MVVIKFKEKEILTFLKNLLGNDFQKCKIFTLNKSAISCSEYKIRKSFAKYLFLSSILIFLLSIAYQYYINVFDYPLMQSGKPLFHLAIALPFAFEITMLFAGIVVFIRFLLVNHTHTKEVPDEVKIHISKLKSDDILLLLPDSLIPQVDYVLNKLVENKFTFEVKRI